MATLATGALTLSDLAKRMNNNNMLAIAEVLSEQNEIIQDAVHIEANGTTVHTYNQRLSEPTAEWSAINGRTKPSKSQVVQKEEGMGELISWSEVTKKLYKLAANPNEFRSSEDLAHSVGLGKKLATSLVYGSLADDAKGITGFANRYNSKAMANVWTAGSSTARTSIFVIQWGKGQVQLLYPRGSKIGIQVDNKGEQTSETSDGLVDVLRTKFTMDTGICVNDDRCIQRIGDIGSTTAFGSSHTVDDFIIKALNAMPSRGAGAMIYMNSTLISLFDIMAKDKTNVNYGTKNVWGEDVTTFKGRPIRMLDKIVNAEDALAS